MAENSRQHYSKLLAKKGRRCIDVNSPNEASKTNEAVYNEGQYLKIPNKIIIILFWQSSFFLLAILFFKPLPLKCTKLFKKTMKLLTMTKPLMMITLTMQILFFRRTGIWRRKCFKFGTFLEAEIEEIDVEADLIVAAGVEEIASGGEIADGARESVREPESKIKSPMMMVAGK